MNSSKILEIKNLHKLFGDFKAVNNISLQVNKGDIYGFLGPNGAGKSTTLRMVLGLIRPSEGNIFIEGENISGNNRRYLNDIGALIEKPDFYKNLSALDNLKILYKMSRLKNNHRVFEVLNEVDLWEKRNQKVGGFSQGMKQRLGIAQTLLHEPSLIILDEPTKGIDVRSKSAVHEFMGELVGEGMSIIMISSELPEILGMCDRVVVMYKGLIKEILDVKNASSEQIVKLASGES